MFDCKELTVSYRGRTVGLLRQLSDGKIGFQYDEKWQKEGFSVSPFSLPLSDRVCFSKSVHFEGLFGVFYDCLPDGWGIRLISRMLSGQGIDYRRLSPLVKLSLVSGNGLGGLEFIPSQSEKKPVGHPSLDELALEAEKLLRDESEDGKTLDDLYRLGGSSGGARPKAHLTLDGEEWIVKFPCAMDGKNAGAEEHRANELAKKSGICVNEYRLFPSKINGGYFGAKRFDRTPDGKVHMISLSSLLETTHRIPNLDYLHLFQVIGRICPNRDDLYEAYRRMCFNVLYGNRDDHGKNSAFLYDESLGGYTLSPFFDITRTPEKIEHEMTVNGNGRPTERDLREICKPAGLNSTRCEEILRQVKDAVHS